jgi:hypothetical protein
MQEPAWAGAAPACGVLLPAMSEAGDSAATSGLWHDQQRKLVKCHFGSSQFLCDLVGESRHPEVMPAYSAAAMD